MGNAGRVVVQTDLGSEFARNERETNELGKFFMFRDAEDVNT